jgi:hypothetical protein
MRDLPRSMAESIAFLLVVGLTAALVVLPTRGEAAVSSDRRINPPGWFAESDQVQSDFGGSAAGAGDVNGDGYDDVIVGAPSYDNGQDGEGRAFAYYGSASGPSATPSWTAESDQAFASFGTSVAAAGDVNGDGYDDVIVGAPSYDKGQESEGRAFAYYGSASGPSATPSWTAEPNRLAAFFGGSAAGAGDVNGDGYDDVIVGATGYDNGEFDEGRAFAYYGSATGLSATPNWTAESDQAFAQLGGSVDGAGDVNGDGYGDVIVGAHVYNDGQMRQGKAFAYYGSADGLSATPNWTAEPNQERTNFGISVAGAGDVNGDGYGDVIVGDDNYDHGQVDEGRAFAYHGSGDGLRATPNWAGESNQPRASFGYSVAGAGDVNADGFGDVIVGAWEYDNGQIDEGRTFSFCGSTAGLSRRACARSESDQASAFFGGSVGGAGDVNADGFGDVIVGASEYDNGQDGEGRAYAYFGRS